MNREFLKLYFDKIQIIRIISLLIFSTLAIITGFEFNLFINSIYSENFYPRPPAVDSFLPISSLMNLRYYFLSGEVHKAHPYGLFFLLSVMIISFVFSKSFCSWVCPFGFLSEILINISKLIFKKDIIIPKYIDIFLRTFKYILLLFFVYVIFSMDFYSLKSFLDSDYNKIADVKMYYFFRNITPFALKIIIVLIVLSFLFNFFWCRYLCPYGAMNAILGFFSPFKIKRDDTKCISCKKCSYACLHYIETDKKKTVISDDCTFCLMCVSQAKHGFLNLKPVFINKKINLFIIPIFIIIVFISMKFISIKYNLWQNNLTQKEYQKLFIKKDELDHPGTFRRDYE